MNRRQAIKNLTSYGLLLGGGMSLSSLAGCATSQPGTSYIEGVVARENMSPVMYWSDVMLQKVRDKSVNPPTASRAFAISHMAGFVAANGAAQKYRTRFDIGQGPDDTISGLAYGAAMARAIEQVFGVSLNREFSHFASGYADADSKTRSIDWGQKVGDAMVARRAGDGSATAADTALYNATKRQDALGWVPTGNHFGAENGPTFGPITDPLLPGWGQIEPFALSSAQAYRVSAFMDERSPEFARQFLKIKALGGANSTIRTADEAQIAFFWEDGPKGVTPPGHWQIIAMDLIQRFDMSLIEQARAMALLSVAQADAGIATWDCKFEYDIVRPETAVRELGDSFDNPALAGQRDPNWETLIPTPPFPAYVSGHSAFSASSARMLAKVLGRDRISFSGKAPDLVNWPTQLTGVTRSWNSLWDAAIEGSLSREYGGIHWEADHTEGMVLGRNVADAVYRDAIVRV